MVSGGYAPDRGHLMWIDFDPQTGREQSGPRTALILSPVDYNRRVGLAVLCPITNRPKGYWYEVPGPATLTTTRVVLADHVKSLDWRSRNAVYIEPATPQLVDEVVQRLATLLV